MSEPYNEMIANRAIEEFASAQAEKIKLEARVRAELRGVLTSDQVMRYHEIERQLRQQRRLQIDQREQNNEMDREMGIQLIDRPGPRFDAEPEEFDLLSLLFFVP
jgi:hypothetical protein